MENRVSLLVVDDSRFMRTFVRKTIEESELKDQLEVVGEAGTGMEAIEKFTSLRPRLIIMDIVMPLGSGMDVLHKIREVDKDVKVIMATALDQMAMRNEAAELGVAGFLVKPFKPEEIISTIKLILTDIKPFDGKPVGAEPKEPEFKPTKPVLPDKKLIALSAHIQSLAKRVCTAIQHMGGENAKVFVISWNVAEIDEMLGILGCAKTVLYSTVWKMHGSGDPVLVSAMPESYTNMFLKAVGEPQSSRDAFWQTLKETFNILQTGLILTLSDDLGLKMVPGSPIFSVDTLGNIADFVTNTIAPEAKYTVFMNLRIVVRGATTNMMGILFLSKKSLTALSKQLKA